MNLNPYFATLFLLVACTPEPLTRFEEAEQLLASNQVIEAVEGYTILARSRSAGDFRARSMLRLGEVYELRLKELPKALEWYQQFVVAYKSDGTRSRELLQAVSRAGEILLRHNGDPSSAILTYERAIEDVPAISTDGRDQLRYRIADVYYQSNDFGQARIELGKLLSAGRKGDALDRAVLLLAQTFFQENAFQLCVKTIMENQSRLSSPKIRMETSFLMAQAFAELGQVGDAVPILMDLKTRYPNPKVIEYVLNRLEAETRGARKSW